MPARPESLSERPRALEEQVDVISDVLDTMRLTTLLFGRVELGAPWAVRAPEKATSSFYVILRGCARLTVSRVEAPLSLSEGDIALIPYGAAHDLDDGEKSTRDDRSLVSTEQLRSAIASPRRLGGDGPVCELISGCFRFSAGMTNPLLDAFPPAIRLSPGAPGASPSLAATARLLAAESTAPGPGTDLILGRLADVLLVQALRMQALSAGEGFGRWQALADPAIGVALRRIHTRPAEAWTVESLAASVGLSRSGFAARFHELVGTPPMQYLAEWRMAKAAQWLRETGDSIATIAERAGYLSEVAFSKAFKRWRGIGPGAYRRGALAIPAFAVTNR
ncbi:AraC family transcriptional regulator [Chondromyces crocatus]|uniref:AraC family transcriptional regulator n=1 Tax=Chondromyces crocatus TaxID=52 RepID=A0A0K1ELZ4_CHOCO|nr:AraC family transcriptional regulator [Chondromyces crocatus]AKT41920.1 AraC family transcriptional regulator [Chondromyces crocatus]